MAQRNDLALPDGATPVITRLVEHYQRQPGLVWMYGQGSVSPVYETTPISI